MNLGLVQLLGLLIKCVVRKKNGKQDPSVTKSRDSSPRQGSQEPSMTMEGLEKGGEN